MEQVENALVISQDTELLRSFLQIGLECIIDIQVEDYWESCFSATQEIIIVDSDCIALLNPQYYNKTVLVLKEGENWIEYANKCTKFIFNRNNKFELAHSLMRDATIKFTVKRIGEDFYDRLMDIIERAQKKTFDCPNTHFDFMQQRYEYKGKQIYLTKKEQLRLAQWLLCGEKDSRTRGDICRIKKRIGDKEFLQFINARGLLCLKGKM